jgi:4-hydroxy-3-methylbut-2-en-1-yl diphosphate reductase
MQDVKPPLTIVLAAPRGFCAGVERAILIVEKALEKFGAPVFVRHEIVHNTFVVKSLEAKGVIFVKDLSAVPPNRPVIFSAHGVPKAVVHDAVDRNLLYLDATCPLVSKVHIEASRLHQMGHHVILIGHKGHPEVIGTLGQLPLGGMSLVETVADIKSLVLPQDTLVGYVTQTTLSVEETDVMIMALKERFPSIITPKKDDICYATTNRQMAVKAMAPQVDAMVVLGSKNSSNSVRLVEVAQKAGCLNTILLDGVHDMTHNFLQGVKRLGMTAGASAPEVLVQDVLKICAQWYTVTVTETVVTQETVRFKLPRALQSF